MKSKYTMQVKQDFKILCVHCNVLRDPIVCLLHSPTRLDACHSMCCACDHGRKNTLLKLRVANLFQIKSNTKPHKVHKLTLCSRCGKANTIGYQKFMMIAPLRDAIHCPVGARYVWLHTVYVMENTSLFKG